MHVFPVERMIAKVSQPNAFTGSMFNTTRALDDAAPIDRMTAGDLSPVRIGEMRLDVSSVGVERWCRALPWARTLGQSIREFDVASYPDATVHIFYQQRSS